jgi:hypothetical protein
VNVAGCARGGGGGGLCAVCVWLSPLERLMGYRNNGAGLQSGFEGYDQWSEVPYGVKHNMPKK